MHFHLTVNEVCCCKPDHTHQLTQILNRLAAIEEGIQIIMSKQDDLQTAIDQIKTATDQQGAVLTQEGTTLQAISDGVTALVAAGVGSTITDAMVASAQALATQTQAVSASLQKQADFSTGIATSLANPVPVPVPPPTTTPSSSFLRSRK